MWTILTPITFSAFNISFNKLILTYLPSFQSNPKKDLRSEIPPTPSGLPLLGPTKNQTACPLKPHKHAKWPERIDPVNRSGYLVEAGLLGQLLDWRKEQVIWVTGKDVWTGDAACSWEALAFVWIRWYGMVLTLAGDTKGNDSSEAIKILGEGNEMLKIFAR